MLLIDLIKYYEWLFRVRKASLSLACVFAGCAIFQRLLRTCYIMTINTLMTFSVNSHRKDSVFFSSKTETILL